MQAASEHAYLALRPDSPPQACDVLLKLDDGTELPVHTRVLARHSIFFRDMLDLGEAGPLSGASATCKIEVPLTDCPREVASGCLSIIYSLPSMSQASLLSKVLLLSIARLAHKSNMEVSTRDICIENTVGDVCSVRASRCQEKVVLYTWT